MMSLPTRMAALHLRASAGRVISSPYSAASVVSNAAQRSLPVASILASQSAAIPLLRGYATAAQTAKKTATAEAKKAKAAAAKEKEKLKLAAQKEKDRLKATAQKEKEKLKLAAEKEKLARRKQLEKEKAQALKDKNKNKQLKAWEAVDDQGKKLPLPTATRPKRMLPFIFYVKERLPQLRNDPEFLAKHGVASGAIPAHVYARSVGDSWKAMSDAEKEKYLEAYRSHDVEYRKALAEWEAGLTEQDRQRITAYNRYIRSHPEVKGRATKVSAAEGQPQRPLNAFMRFARQWRLDNPDQAKTPVSEMAKKAAEAWKNVDPAQKESYESASRAEGEAYRKAVEQWKQQTGAVSI